MQKLLIISNRLPVSIQKKRGNFIYKPSLGGLATGLGSFYKIYNSIWVGWPGITKEGIKNRKDEIKTKLLSEYSCYPIFFSNKNYDDYYNGFCNNILWPLFHYFPQYTIYDNSLWEAYKTVNYKYYKEIIEIAGPKDIIWIHDYHLMLLPQLIRKKLPEARIGFFLHIPFPSYELFRLLPWRKEILNGILGADLIGFHTYGYERHFNSSVYRILGFEVKLSQINTEERIIKVDVFPMGINYDKFHDSRNDPLVRKTMADFRKKFGNRKIILSIDRLDYTKGILKRMEAYNLFIKNNPEVINNVILVLVAVPSRIKVKNYKKLKKMLDEVVGRINGHYGTLGWSPIWYINRFLPIHQLMALYNLADIALATPLRDGMNLIAKEYVASKSDGKGVLIISETAGSAKELCESIIINPYDREEIARSLKEALIMKEQKQKKRIYAIQKRIKNFDVFKWAKEFLRVLSETKNLQNKIDKKILTSEIKNQLLIDYDQGEKRIFFLDYDGTLIPFFDHPQDAKPTQKLLNLLKKLINDEKNNIVLISGRDKDTLENWFSKLNINIVGEHGLWIKEINSSWEMIEPIKLDWKDEVKPILARYTYRTPGSFIEVKDLSLVWHYRNVNSGLGEIRARELANILVDFTSNYNLQVLEGNKVIEIKHSGINKGRAALRWLSREDWDFILGVGDDWTDEDLFSILPKSAYSFRVGYNSTKARFNLESFKKVRSLLSELVARS